MADTKKNNVAGKIATPKTTVSPATAAPQPPIDPLEALRKSMGARIKLTTAGAQPQSYEGVIFTACPILNVVIINTRKPPTNASADSISQAADFRIIPISRVSSFQIVSLAADLENNAPSFATAQPPIGPVDIKRLKDREQAKIEKLKEEERDRGKGVTKEAQAIFDSFKRINMPIRWNNQDMVVYEAVIIPPPYRVEDCRSPKDKQEVLTRVKKVLEGERKKLKDREDKERKAATPAGPRKGG